MERTKPARRRLLPPLRLRHKLGLSLSIAALLPVLVASSVAVSIVLRGLDRGLSDETERQLHVGLNLMLRTVEGLGSDAARLSGAGDLSKAMTEGKDRVNEFLSSASPHLPSSLVQVTDERGTIIAQRVVGGVASRFEGLGVDAKSSLVRAGLGFERRVTVVPVGALLVVRAVAPIVDESYMLQGVVVVTVPMDGEFADGLKAALGTDVLIFAMHAAGDPGYAMSTFLDAMGARQRDIQVGPEIARRVQQGEPVLTNSDIAGRSYSVGYTPLLTLQGKIIGSFAVAVDRVPLLRAKRAARRSLALGAAGAFVFALGLAGVLSRRITRPIQRLHRGAVAVARGDLDHRIHIDEGDEIGDLATAFSHMTSALKENQRRLAARMREIVALHDAGRAVSSVITQKQVLRKIVDSVSRVLDVRLCAIWTVEMVDDERELRLGAARAQSTDLQATVRGDEGALMAAPLTSIASEVAAARATLRIDRVSRDKQRRGAALEAGVTGSLLATPLERKGAVVGVIVIGRTREARPFSEADSNLLATFADQAATAVENARLYEEVRAFNEELEAKVRLRTTELTAMNQELGRTITELKETQSQLILSERLAGLGLLVAGVAHEINSPSAAIRGSADALAENVRRLSAISQELATAHTSPDEWRHLSGIVTKQAPVLAAQRIPAAAGVRRVAREMRAKLEEAGFPPELARDAAMRLGEIGAADGLLSELVKLYRGATTGASGDASEGSEQRIHVFLAYLTEQVYLHRNTRTISNAIKNIQRIVGALKSYSHLDQNADSVASDIHDGIEDTLVILDHVLRDITVEKHYGDVPPVPVYVDELNQVWTNLIHNGVQALGGHGTICIETDTVEDGIVVRVIDDGPGIPEDIIGEIFEPFFTTKAKGEGTGLGLGIVRQIIEKHEGRISCESRPGRTSFEVWLPLVRQVALEDSEDVVG